MPATRRRRATVEAAASGPGARRTGCGQRHPRRSVVTVAFTNGSAQSNRRSPERPATSGPYPAQALLFQTSKFPSHGALDSLNARRGSTSSPIRVVKIWSAPIASSICTRSSRRTFGSIVVSQSCSEFISPSPL